MSKFFKPLHQGFARALGVIPMAACVACQPAAHAGRDDAPTNRHDADVVSVMTDSINYMHKAGVQYTLYDLSKEPAVAVGGAIVYMLGTGGEKGCCLALPRVWRPGLQVRLKWHESDRERSYEEHTRDLEIPPYRVPADLHVVFHPAHEVELVVSAAEPGHPEWRGRLKKTPWQQCLSEYERKVCKAALPKQFDTSSYRGYCLRATADKRPNAEDNCAFLTGRCMKDYEDGPFCRAILWTEERK
jgi:hypothetical protein